MSSSNHKEESQIFSSGVVLQNRWEVIRLIGRGSFSEIYSARDLSLDSNDPAYHVAIKAQLKVYDNALSIMKWESSVMQNMRDLDTIPNIFGTGDQHGVYYFAMELLTGDDMSKLRNCIRDANPTRLIPINIGVYLAREMLRNLREIHMKGYVHRDVKPSNFVRKNKKTNKFYTVDFGLAKLYRDPDGTIRKSTGIAEFRGTTMYASPFTHHGLHQCPRDDLMSVLHVFLDLICAFLPWGADSRTKEKTRVVSSKNACYEDTDKFIAQQVTATRAVEELQKIPVEKSNFPLIAQEKMKCMMDYLKQLQFESDIDYDLLDKLFQECIPSEEIANVADINFHCEYFRWIDESSDNRNSLLTMPTRKRVISSGDLSQGETSLVPPSKRIASSGEISQGEMSPPPPPPPPRPPAITGDPINVAIRNLTTRITNLQQQPREPHPSSQISLDQHIAATAGRWRHCFVELQKLPIARVTTDMMSTFALVLEQYLNFFKMNIANWTEFENLQLDIMRFHELHRAVQEQAASASLSSAVENNPN